MTNKINCPHCGKTITGSLDDRTWADIKKNHKTVNVGDIKTETLITGEVVEFVCIDKNRDGANLTFANKNLFDFMLYMNNENTNEGSWRECFMRKTNMPRVEKLLSAELQASIKEVSKFTNGMETKDRLFLFSKNEVFGTDETCKDNQYEFYKDEKNREKLTNSGNDYWWWLRSPDSTNAPSFRGVFSTGNLSGGLASFARGVCLGFCV